MTFYSTASGTDVQLGSPVSVSVDGTASATISADGVASGVYTIKAVYSGAANYAGSEGSLTASLSLRGISGTASYDKTVGDTAFKLVMKMGALTSTDVWTYQVAEDSFANFTREDGSKAEATVTVSDDGQVSINHAGTALIEVTLSDTSGTYADQTVYVTVTVGKASLVVEPYAYGEDPETPIVGGLASFDTEATVFQEDPTLAIDATVTGSSDFRSLSVKRNADGSVASYESAVYATGGSAANYEVTFTRGNLTVEPESLADAARIIASADATAFTYNGSTQVPASFSVTDGGSELAENTDYTVSLPDSSTDAGDYVVTLTGVGNYTGTVTVAYTIAKAPLSVITPGASKVYDGTALTKADGATLQGLVGNETATVIGTGSQVDAGSSSNGYGIVWDGTAKESNYTVASESLGTLTVSRRTLTIETSSATKVYDGTPLTASGTVRGLADGDTVTFATTGSQTDPGSSKNSYTLDWDGTAKFTNYDVWENLGTLTVTQTADQIVVTTTGGTFEYDGRPHGASVTVSQLPAGLRVVEAESSATATHVSDGEVKATADKLKIINELGEDVTDKLNITYVDGTISIVPRRLFVSTKGGTKLYDGTPLAAIKGAKLEGLVAGETATLVATGSQTDAGSSPNTYQIQWGTAHADDYQVSESLGTLTVTASSSGDPAVKDSQPASAVASNGSSVARGAAQAGGTPNIGDNTAFTAIVGVAVAGAALIALALCLRAKKGKR